MADNGKRGRRIEKERLRQGHTRNSLAELARVHPKTVQRIEEGERTRLAFKLEEALGLGPFGEHQPRHDTDTEDHDRLLRSVPHDRFWVEAARRAILLTGQTPTAEPVDEQRPPRGRLRPLPEHLKDDHDHTGKPETASDSDTP